MEMRRGAWHSEDGIEMSTWKAQISHHHAVAYEMASLQQSDNVQRGGCLVTDLEKSRARPTSTFDQLQKVCC